MATASPIPIAICGKLPSHVEALTAGLKPDYEVVHHANSVPHAVSELPLALAPASSADYKSASIYGSNQHSAAPVPFKAVIVGGGFSADDVAIIRSTAGLAERGDLIWLHATAPPAGAGPPPVEQVVERVKAKLAELGLGTERGEGKGGLYHY